MTKRWVSLVLLLAFAAKFNYAKQGEKARYVDIPFVDLGAEPLRSEVIPDGQRRLPDAEFQKLKEERGLTEIKVFPRNTDDVQRLASQSGWTTDSSKTVNVLDQTYVFTLRRVK